MHMKIGLSRLVEGLLNTSHASSDTYACVRMYIYNKTQVMHMNDLVIIASWRTSSSAYARSLSKNLLHCSALASCRCGAGMNPNVWSSNIDPRRSPANNKQQLRLAQKIKTSASRVVMLTRVIYKKFLVNEKTRLHLKSKVFLMATSIFYYVPEELPSSEHANSH